MLHCVVKVRDFACIFDWVEVSARDKGTVRITARQSDESCVVDLDIQGARRFAEALQEAINRAL